MKPKGLNAIVITAVIMAMVALGCHISQKSKTAGISSQHPIPYPGPEKFADHIRSTEFQTPAQEQAGFKLPPGFEITLYASPPMTPVLYCRYRNIL